MIALYVLIIFILIKLFEIVLKLLNLNYMKKNSNSIPDLLKGYIDLEILKKTNNYTYDKTFYSLLVDGFSSILIILFIYSGLINYYSDVIYKYFFSYGIYISGIVYFFILFLINLIISLPFDYYYTFVIEKKHNFSNTTLKLWISDQIKSILISIVIISILVLVAILITTKFKEIWWLLLFMFYSLFSILLIILSPILIEPLFNKYEVINDEDLIQTLKKVLEKSGLKINKIFKVDESKRTKHSNAYFSGLGATKKIVLFDNLLSILDKNEIAAVLAHEAGHWKKNHIVKNLIFVEFIVLLIIYISYLILNTNIVESIFLLKVYEYPFSLFPKSIILYFLFSIILFFFVPFFNIFSRKKEKEADMYAIELCENSNYLITALLKLVKDNLSNIFPHPLYAKIYYSHPPILDRIDYLKNISVRRDENDRH